VAKLAYAAGQPDTIALLCGPAGVGKTTVLRIIATDGLPQGYALRVLRWTDRDADGMDLAADRSQMAVSEDAAALDVLLVDDAHRAAACDLVDFVDRCRRRYDGVAIVLAGEGRLLSLMAADARLERSVRLRATLPTFTLAESRQLLAPVLPAGGAEVDRENVIRTIHEIAGGVPAISVRLAEMATMLVAAESHRHLTPDDVEMIHRRLSLTAA
jgi:type II secretory pathway predicted ATPase ExeA